MITEVKRKIALAKKKKYKPQPASSVSQKRLFNRELSWLEFNSRVLNEALDRSLPVLERLKFLSIFSTNLDEFFMIRVAGLKEQIDEDIYELSPDGLTAQQQLEKIRERLMPMLVSQMKCLREDVLPLLAKEGIQICSYESLDPKDKKRLDLYFMKNVFPVLTPQAVDSSHPFPYVSNLSLNLGLFVEPGKHSGPKGLKTLFNQRRFVRIKIPPMIPRLVPITEKSTRFVPLGELIAANIKHLFPNMKTGECHLFRVTRDADLELREDESGDLLRTMEQELHRRRFGFAVRIEVSSAMPDEMAEYLSESIGVEDEEVYRIDGFLNIPDMMSLYSLDFAALKDKPITTTFPMTIRQQKKIFDVLKRRDIFLHHPYASFSTVTEFINKAAEDPDVQAIKICLYRTGKDSPIVKALLRASELGKQVAALVELKARFDEENNIEWARILENEGVHVIYGVRGFKTHSKLTLVVRKEGKVLRRYVHVATGNYNPVTARLYTDMGILTSDEEIGADATDLFNFLTGFSHQTKYRKLLVAPVNMRTKLTELIRREVNNKLEGKPAHIIIKVNSITDEGLVEELYAASKAGVKIELVVRGICVLRPQVKGLSENIKVTSIVGRFLEHSRIFYFANSGEEEIYFGSADLMHRNLERRVEILAPVKDKKIHAFIKDEILKAYLKDTYNSWSLRPDGSYEKAEPPKGETPFDSQMALVGMDV